MPTISDPGDPDEQAVIDGLTACFPGAPPWVRVGPGDDGAVLSDGTVLAADCMVQGVHWDDRVAAEDVGYKLAVSNLSDLGAMGAVGRWALLTLSLPRPVDAGWVAAFGRGLAEGLGDVPLLGGDTTRSPGPILASLSVGGHLASQPLLRSGASPGDWIWVSGTLGDAAAGFASDAPAPALWRAWTRPAPPLALGPALATQGLATAALDLSDGLAQDLARLCAASKVGARVDPAALPRSSALDPSDPALLAHQVAWGEDYQLLFTTPPEARDAVEALGRTLGVRLTCVGHCTAGPTVDLAGAPWPPPWRHFAPATAERR